MTNEVNDPLLLEGHLSIEACLRAGFRELYCVYVDEKKRYDRQFATLLRRLAEKEIEIRYVPRQTIDNRASGQTHGGLLAEVSEREFASLGSLIPADRNPFIVMLDGIEDPFNFGYTVRSLYAAGVDGVVLRPRNWSSAAAVVGRSSAGASESIRMAIAETAQDAADFYAAQGLTIAVTAKSEKSQSIYQTDLCQSLFILLGGEKRGITRSFMEKASLHLEIDYGRKFGQSLGTVAASSVIAFELMRQRQA